MGPNLVFRFQTIYITNQILVSDKCHQNLVQTGQTDRQTDGIEDVERGAELSFSGRGPLRGPPHMVREADPPLHHRQILFSTNQIFHQNVLVSDRTDGRTDRQTDGQIDRRNKYVLGLPSFKKLSSE